MDFIALDFETANSSRDSVCAIGLVEYKEGRLVREYYRLVKPRRNYFASINVSIHGITKEDVKDAPEFDELWNEEIRSLVEGKFLIAHNAKFDMGVLRAVLDQYRIPYPMLAYNCTLNISRKTWSLPRYNLKSLSDHLGIKLNHHQALDDAKASAQIFIKAADRLNALNVKQVVENSRTTNGVLYERGYEPARINKAKRVIFEDSYKYLASSREISNPLNGSSVVFTGRLNEMKRDQASKYISQYGGKVEQTITSTTNYIIVGKNTYERYKKGEKTKELERTEVLLSHGHSIEILSETEFIKLLQG